MKRRLAPRRPPLTLAVMPPPAEAPSFAVGMKELLFGTKLNVLLVCVPLAIGGSVLHLGDRLVFIASLLALCPLAERLGFVTEQLAMYTNPTVGGLLNATFGNVTEMLVSILAIHRGLLRVVQLSLLGSVLSNLLLVLGTAFFCGGLRQKVQTFNTDVISANNALLVLGALAILLPAILDASGTALHRVDDKGADELALSRFSSVILLAVYFAYLYFQLVSHADLFDEDGGAEEAGAGTATELTRLADDESRVGAPDSPRPEAAPAAEKAGGGGDDDEEEEAVLGKGGSLFWLAVLTVLVALLSEYIVNTIETSAKEFGMPLAFVSTILLPIVGNAAEHASAIIFAMKNKMDIAIGVAVGSSTQITVLAMPFAVVYAWAVGQPLTLDLLPFETAVFAFSILGTGLVLSHGRSTWLLGLAMLTMYVCLAGAFYLHDDGEHPHQVLGLQKAPPAAHKQLQYSRMAPPPPPAHKLQRVPRNHSRF